MFWDRVANVYDKFEDRVNADVNKKMCLTVTSYINHSDDVLECACGTGIITTYIGIKCHKLMATDISRKMLDVAKEKCKTLDNVRFKRAEITYLNCHDNFFDKVVAGNVIHLLEDDDAEEAISELVRVCKVGGKIIIPTYIDFVNEDAKPSKISVALDKMGVGFQKYFTYESYQEYFYELGYKDIEFQLIEGKIPCAIAIITKYNK